ncbi:MAG: transporter substrate-binding domain-containing protein [Desulfarculaceae bacterium]|nr:transporter substrate-binding domain-containing protein [Desulfarculaceae bacterium]
MYKRIFTAVFLVFSLLGTTGASADGFDDLNVLTEYYPPFNYEEENRTKGISVDLLLEVTDEMGSGLERSDIQLGQWSKVYQQTKNQPGNMLFSTTRTEKRENLFKWAGPIASNQFCLIVKKANGITITDINDIMKKNLKVTVVHDDVAQQMLQSAGVPDDNMIERPFPGLCIMDLHRNNVDAMAYGKHVAMWMLGLYGFNSYEYTSAYTIQEGDLYYAFNKKVEDDVVNRFQQALDTVKASGEFDAILNRYR